MPLVSADGAAAANTALNTQIIKQQNGEAIKTPTDMAKDFAAAYHEYAKSATLLGADMSNGGTVAILESAFISDNTPTMVAKIAQGICDYWSTFITVGIPAHGGTTVVSVVVTGAAVLASMTAAVQALITNVATEDGWLGFYDATEAVVKTIPCIITEMIPGTPPVAVPFPETIT